MNNNAEIQSKKCTKTMKILKLTHANQISKQKENSVQHKFKTLIKISNLLAT